MEIANLQPKKNIVYYTLTLRTAPLIQTVCCIHMICSISQSNWANFMMQHGDNTFDLNG